MNTEAAFDASSPQYAFLAAELAGIDRVATPWVLFAGHRPTLIDSDYGAEKPLSHRDGMADPSDVGVALALQKWIWPLLHKHKVGGVSHVFVGALYCVALFT